MCFDPLVLLLQEADHRAKFALGLKFSFDSLLRTDLTLMMIRPVESRIHDLDAFFKILNERAVLSHLQARLRALDLPDRSTKCDRPITKVNELTELEHGRISDGEPGARTEEDRINPFHLIEALLDLLELLELPGQHPEDQAIDVFTLLPQLVGVRNFLDQLIKHLFSSQRFIC